MSELADTADKQHVIAENFKAYDRFLSTLDEGDKKHLRALKMMYSIHMENAGARRNILFLLKQAMRFAVKFFGIPFYRVGIKDIDKVSYCAMIENSEIEEYITDGSIISLAALRRSFSINLCSVRVYKSLFRSLYHLYWTASIKKAHVLGLSHTLIDYFMTYYTADLKKIKVLMMENDRSPVNMALLNLAHDKKCKTVKYDNWLIDPVHHNDVYCEYYFYPSLYHKKIIEGYGSNQGLKYVKGGFLYWDRLSSYQKYEGGSIKKVIYFTQFGISPEVHAAYIQDISDCMDKAEVKYEMIIKIHPKEDKGIYQALNKFGEIVSKHNDLYALIADADYCFSIFSTVSLEAKHIINNSFFVNYQADKFDLVDYAALQLDLIESKEALYAAVKGEYTPISQEEFIRINNCSYPQTVGKLRESFCDD